MTGNVIHLDSLVRWHCALANRATLRGHMAEAIRELDRARSLWRLQMEREGRAKMREVLARDA
jgi:hypothetical protein